MPNEKKKSDKKENEKTSPQEPKHDQPVEGGRVQIEEAIRIQSYDLPEDNR